MVVTKNQLTKAKDPVILLDSTYLETEKAISRTLSTVKTDFTLKLLDIKKRMDNFTANENISFTCGGVEPAQLNIPSPVVLGFLNLVGILNNIYLVTFASIYCMSVAVA